MSMNENEDEVKAEVWKTIHEMNQLWTSRNQPGQLANYFHRDMVAITPSARLRVEGRDACVASWKAFAGSATIREWKEIDPLVKLFGKNGFAVVTYYYEMTCDMQGQTLNLSGRDMFTMVNENGKWWVAADQFSPNP
jgi:hypothetical protein